MPAAGTEVTAPSRLRVRVVLNWFGIFEQRVPKR
jgi:hypothetical protein